MQNIMLVSLKNRNGNVNKGKSNCIYYVGLKLLLFVFYFELLRNGSEKKKHLLYV